ncbi:MAG: RNA methyltransferase [Candidatus Omnitrophica bacterium]|nr:RNA methyltransferase [Candidatus Omnitrophota bacterium]
MKITSFTNPRISQVLKLRDGKARRENHLTVVEGAREFERAHMAGVRWSEVFWCPEFYQKYEEGLPIEVLSKKLSLSKVPVHELSEKVFEKISFGNRREGIIGVCEVPKRSLKDVKVASQASYVVIENVEKPGNLGAILRTADAAGVAAVLVADPTTDIYNPQVVRASVGTVFCLPVVQATAEEIFQFFRKNAVTTVAATPQGQKLYTQVDLKKSVAFIVGSEDKGLNDFWLKSSDFQVRIPMKGKADSLNVSNTVAVLVYEALRQRS